MNKRILVVEDDAALSRTLRINLEHEGFQVECVADGGLAIEAAANGFGRASVPAMLAARDIADGRVRAIGDPSVGRVGYWLIAPLPQWRQKKVKALVEALAG